MAPTRDYFRQLTTVTGQEAAAIRTRAVQAGQDIIMTDPVVDHTWARWSTQSKRPSNYCRSFS